MGRIATEVDHVKALEVRLIDRMAVMQTYDVPAHLREGIAHYIETGQPVGGFLYAVLTNDLLQAVKRADPVSLDGLVGIVQYLFMCVPLACWGSAGAVEAWAAHRGLEGFIKEIQ